MGLENVQLFMCIKKPNIFGSPSSGSPTQNLQPTKRKSKCAKIFVSCEHIKYNQLFYLLAGEKQKSREWFESINCQLYHVLHS